MATVVPHETQEGCIAALHEEIGRTKTILASLKPNAGREASADGDARVQQTVDQPAGEHELS